MLEQYYVRASSQFYTGVVVPEIKPEFHYQIGATPENVEHARNHCERIRGFSEESKALTECPPEKDAKWRYFWRIGEFANVISENEYANICPEDFPQWETTMNTWGYLLLSAVDTVVRMFEIANELKPGTIIEKMRGAPHLLAPTGSDVGKYNIGTIFAGFHYDLNFITIHGKSRYPGLFAWLRNGKRIPVRIGDGCLLLQAGIMFEKLTGGFVMGGFHEVVFNEATQEAVNKAREEGRPLWRVSSTLFSHLRYDVVIEPLPELEGKMNMSLEEARIKYPPMTAEEVVIDEIKQIRLWVD